ncbi:MAG: NAD(P)H-dependent oxidoreductase subunit E [bacterium]|nr:NAD(P)H-dependent oxidoreductase subunit E [bacterium]
MNEEKVKLPDSLLEYIGQWKNKKGNVIMVLHKVQELYGFIPRAVAMEVSTLINIPLAKIYGIITFYHLFKLKKPGKYRISVCLGTACYLSGGNDIMAELENILGIGVNHTTDDGIFSIEAVRCLGCCGLAPVLVINEKVYGKLKKEDLAAILGRYRNQEAAVKA